jgi:hypothetical protein
MNTQHQDDYLLLFRGNAWLKQLSDAEIQKVTSEWMAWFEGLVQAGKCKGGHPLRDVGKLVAGKRGHIVIDGPFAESKEAIGGYFLLRVADEAEAVAIAQNARVSDTAASSRCDHWPSDARTGSSRFKPHRRPLVSRKAREPRIGISASGEFREAVDAPAFTAYSMMYEEESLGVILFLNYEQLCVVRPPKGLPPCLVKEIALGKV